MATTSTSNVACNNSSLTRFKAWAQLISNALSAFGWTKTSDTGQVNWSSIAAVPSSNYVYEVWQAADSVASTTPIILRIDYGYNTSNPSLKVTVGSSSDGAGNITGSVMGPFWVMGGDTNLANQGTTNYACYFSGNAGEFRAMLWQSNATACCVFGVERSKDTSGNVTNEYVTLLGLYANPSMSNPWFQQTMAGGAVTTPETSIFTCVSSASPQTGTFGGTTAATPVFPLVGKIGNPMLGFFAVAAADVGEGATVTVNAYGANHTYVATKQNSIGGNLGKLNNSGGAILMRYE